MNEDSAAPADNRPGDCYSAGERQAMQWSQQLRARWLGPMLRGASWLGLRAGHVTFASLASGLAFFPLYVGRDHGPWMLPAALGALLLHVLLDGFDGPLARHQGRSSRRGSFTDTCSDQVVVTTTTLALITCQPPVLGQTWGGIYIFLYTMVVAFAMVRNALGVPYSWLIRPRFWVYGWIAIEAYYLPGTMDYVVGLFSLALLLKMLTGFAVLRRIL
jgi:phosphatidylglycerophosphate synthase